MSSCDIVFGETFSSTLEYTSHPYSEALATQPAVLYITYTTSSHEQTGSIITFAQFEEGNLVENKHNLSEYESIFASIYESSTDNESDDGSIHTNYFEVIWDEKYAHPDINAKDAKLKIRDRI